MGGFIFYNGWARKVAEKYPFVNNNVDDTIGFLISFAYYDYETVDEYKDEFRKNLREKNIKLTMISEDELIDLCAKKIDFKPWEN